MRPEGAPEVYLFSTGPDEWKLKGPLGVAQTLSVHLVSYQEEYDTDLEHSKRTISPDFRKESAAAH